MERGDDGVFVDHKPVFGDGDAPVLVPIGCCCECDLCCETTSSIFDKVSECCGIVSSEALVPFSVASMVGVVAATSVELVETDEPAASPTS